VTLLGLSALGSAHLGPRATELLDGRLPAAEELAVRGHLASCRDCAAAVQDQQAVRATLRRLDVPGPRPDLLAGLLAVSLTPATPQLPGAAVHRPLVRTPTRGRVTTAVMGTVALASVGALGIGAFAGLPVSTVRPVPSAAVGSSSVRLPVLSSTVPASTAFPAAMSDSAALSNSAVFTGPGLSVPGPAGAVPVVVVPVVLQVP